VASSEAMGDEDRPGYMGSKVELDAALAANA